MEVSALVQGIMGEQLPVTIVHSRVDQKWQINGSHLLLRTLWAAK